MSIVIALLFILLAGASEAIAEDPSPTRQLRLSSRELTALLLNAVPSRPDTIEIDAFSDAPAERGGTGLPPFFTLLPPQAVDPKDSEAGEPPLFAFGARIQGRTLVAFTRPGTKTDPDDRVVYQRLVVSDLFQGRSFAVTVFEDHALGGGGSQVLGFGARLLLRPAFTIGGWRTRVEMFASYDMTLGAVGSIGITARSPAPPVVVPIPIR